MKTPLLLPLALGVASGALSSPALAQSQLQARRTPGPLRDAGTYHVATKTWTRTGASSAISPDAIYRNDAPSGYFGSGWDGCWTMDEIMLPGPGNPFVGSQDTYVIDGYQFSYCSNGPGTVDWSFQYFDAYVPCDDPSAPASCMQAASVLTQLSGLPGATACWLVAIDLAGGYEFCFDADGGACAPGYQGSGLDLDHGAIGFAWSSSSGATVGPVLAGDPQWAPKGEGTCYHPSYTVCTTTATGLGAQDMFSISNFNGLSGCAVTNGCFFFGGYSSGSSCSSFTHGPLGQFHFILFADCSATCSGSGTTYCDQAQNPNNYGNCAISTLDSGAASISVTLSNAAPNQFTYLLVGDGNGTVHAPPGSVGDLCVVGGSCLGRYDKDVGKTSTFGTFATDVRNALSNPCAGGVTITPGSTWNFQFWHRQPVGAPSTFSDALAVTFQ